MFTSTVRAAAGVFAPGHLGELTWWLPFELVDAVPAETGAAERRLRRLPSRVGVYFVLALVACAPAEAATAVRTRRDVSRRWPGSSGRRGLAPETSCGLLDAPVAPLREAVRAGPPRPPPAATA
ncbi:transposase domain-containing protein [Spirillospora sp. NPDC048911]|uniref:transposase domain-containing protein n=1 Tax=Spirillospora sp. NPDC048911 TaxID=3364527 RepID=UPI0037242C7A